ncbi:MAG: exosortase [Pseudomonadota bacterium]
MLTVFTTVSIAFLPATEHLLARWLKDPTYGHGLLLAPLIVWIIAKAVEGISSSRLYWPALWLAVTGISAMALAQLLGIVALYQLILPLVLCAMLVALYGRDSLSRVLPTTAMLYFCLPLWDVINPALQQWTSIAVGQMTYIAGTPAFIEGNMVTVSTGIFEIAAGCSGLRFFIISAAVSALYGHWYLARSRDALMLVAIAMLIAIVGNWIRVFVVIQMGIRLGIDHPQVVDHTFAGWAVFVATMMVVFWIASRLQEAEPEHEGTASATASPGIMRLAVVAGSCVLVVALAFAARFVIVSGSAYDPPRLADDSTSRTSACGVWRTAYRRPAVERRGAILWEGEPLCIDVAWYRYQRQGSELLSGANRAVAKNRAGENPVLGRFLSGGDEVFVARYPSGEGVWVAVRHRIGDGVVTSPIQAKWLQLAQLFQGRMDARMVAVAQRCDNNCRTAMLSGQPPIDAAAALDAAEARLVKD